MAPGAKPGPDHGTRRTLPIERYCRKCKGSGKNTTWAVELFCDLLKGQSRVAYTELLREVALRHRCTLFTDEEYATHDMGGLG